MKLRQISIRNAKQFVDAHHRHHRAPQGAKFAIGLTRDGSLNDDELIGVVIVGRPVSRMLDDGWTAEVTRLCVLDGYKNACSMLYAAAWRCAQAMGYQKIITYILESEPGTSLLAAGWWSSGPTGGGSWHRNKRPRTDKHPLEQKSRFEKTDPKRPRGSRTLCTFCGRTGRMIFVSDSTVDTLHPVPLWCCNLPSCRVSVFYDLPPGEVNEPSNTGTE